MVDATTGQARVVGIWNNFSYQVTYDVQPAFILGRYSAAELTRLASSPSITAQGWRVVNHGPFKTGRLTNVKDLLHQEYLLLQVWDRQTKKYVANIRGCLPTGTSSTVSREAAPGVDQYVSGSAHGRREHPERGLRRGGPPLVVAEHLD
jgi:hypothetical protein